MSNLLRVFMLHAFSLVLFCVLIYSIQFSCRLHVQPAIYLQQCLISQSVFVSAVVLHVKNSFTLDGRYFMIRKQGDNSTVNHQARALIPWSLTKYMCSKNYIYAVVLLTPGRKKDKISC